MSLLRVKGLVKNYGRRRVVDGVDFHVERGEIVGLLGPNGAGKTTTFRMTCGMIDADAGKVSGMEGGSRLGSGRPSTLPWERVPRASRRGTEAGNSSATCRGTLPPPKSRAASCGRNPRLRTGFAAGVTS